MPSPIWLPRKSNSTETPYIKEFMRQANMRFHQRIDDYPLLHQWSITHPENFWQLVWEFCKIKYSAAPTQILKKAERMQDSQWFIGARLNFAENLLTQCDNKNTAIIALSERGDHTNINFTDLYKKVAGLAAYLRTIGLKAGDRVVAMLPNTIESVIAMLATTSVGAIWSACSPDFGLAALVDRFQQIQPNLLITVDGHFYRGKFFSHQQKNRDLQAALGDLKKTLLFNYTGTGCTKSLANCVDFNDCMLNTHQDLQFEQLPFNHPVYILYSSGTTGKPKCMVHGAGGTLLQHLKEHILHTNIQPQSRLFFNTTVSWMMWHWMVSGLAHGETIILYEGSPFHPKPDMFFDLIDQARISFFGVGAKFFEVIAKANIKPAETHQLTSLTCILSTGSPLMPNSFEYINHNIKSDVQISSISGGSDIISCFALGNPLLPVYSGELQCIGLGMDVKIFNDKGESVVEEKGELVCASPFPSMPIYFWNDLDGSKYQQAYFEKFNSVWTHGDYAKITEHGGIVIYGRSDATLNPSGVRIGSAEIYQQLESFEEISESLVIGQKWHDDERILLFVILRKNNVLDENLTKKIKTHLRNHASPYHVPAAIFAVKDFPRTPNNKIAEIAVKKTIHGELIDNKGALANPESLKEFERLRQTIIRDLKIT